jgi:hypothetical protein
LSLNPLLSPPSTPAEFFQPTYLRGQANNFGNFLIKVLDISCNSEHPQIIFHLKPYFFCKLKSHAKFENPKTPPSGRKVTPARRASGGYDKKIQEAMRGEKKCR